MTGKERGRRGVGEMERGERDDGEGEMEEGG